MILAFAGIGGAAILKLLLSLVGSGLAVKGGSAIAKSLFGGAAKKIGSGIGSAAAKAAGTGVGQQVGRGALAARGALPKLLQRAIPPSREAALSSAGSFLKRDLGQNIVLGAGGFFGSQALLDSLFSEPAQVVGEASLAGQPANANDELSNLIRVISGDVEDGNLESPELQQLLNALSTQQQPQRRLI